MDWYKCFKCTACFENQNERLIHQDQHTENQVPGGRGDDVNCQLFFTALNKRGLTINKLRKGVVQCFIPKITLIPLEEETNRNMIRIDPCQIKLERLNDEDISKLIEESNKIQLRKRKRTVNYDKDDDDEDQDDFDPDEPKPKPRRERRAPHRKTIYNDKEIKHLNQSESVFCKLCDPYLEFPKRNSDYYKHLADSHRNPEDETYACPKCPFITKPAVTPCRSRYFQAADRNIIKHITVFHELGDYICYICNPNAEPKSTKSNPKFESTKELTEHIDKMHSNSSSTSTQDPATAEESQFQYQCQICNLESFPNPLELNYHTICHRFSSSRDPIIPTTFYKRKSQFKCKLCNKIKYSQSEMRYHMELHQKNPNKFQNDLTKPHSCPVCQTRFLSRKSLLQHLNKHSGGYKCDICSHNFISKDHLRRHLFLHFPRPREKQIICPVCNKVYCRKENLAIHLRLHHSVRTDGETFRARTNYARKKFGNLKQIDPVPAQLPNTQILCPVCNREYSRTEHLNQHLSSYHTVRTDGKTLRPPTKFRRMRQQIDPVPTSPHDALPPIDQLIPPKSEIIDPELVEDFRSQLTDVVSTTELIQSSFSKSHPKLKDEKYKCMICPNISYERLFHFQVHNKKHHPETVKAEVSDVSLTCGTCGFKSISPDDLKIHLETHISDGRKFQCSLCSGKFRAQDQLDEHFTRVHIHQRNPYKISECPICNKCFKNAKSLRSHTFRSKGACSGALATPAPAPEITPGEQGVEGKHYFKCSKCPKITLSKNHLSRHEKIHLPNRKFMKCRICNDKFATKCTLQKHIAAVHFKIKNIPITSRRARVETRIKETTNEIDSEDIQIQIADSEIITG